ncbi:hypothetical protein G6F46_014962 [Rhizopus delemar]|nr:hypothetical protein G6F46_014962 [Rhizopus delemar]
MRADVDLLNATNFYTDRLFGLWVSVDMLQPDRTAPYLVQGGLGMPDRDFYLGGGRMAELRKQYQAYIAQMLQLAGAAAPASIDASTASCPFPRARRRWAMRNA